MEEFHSKHDARILSQRHSLRNNNSLRHPKDTSPKPRNIEILNPGKSKINPPKRRNSRSIFRGPLENASKFPPHSSLHFNILGLHETHRRIEIMGVIILLFISNRNQLFLLREISNSDIKTKEEFS